MSENQKKILVRTIAIILALLMVGGAISAILPFLF